MSTTRNPLVTLAVITYNQGPFVAEAVASALAQTYAPLEVVVSDDCSKDDTYDIIQAIAAGYAGPHRLIVHRNEANLGLAGNVNKVWELSSGELVVFQGGDDISMPDRVKVLVDAWQAHEPRPDLVYSGVTLIDDSGTVIGEKLGVVAHTPTIDDTVSGRRPFVAGGCAAAYARNLHFAVGPLNADVISEDFVYSFRALLGNGVLGIGQPLVKYRQHQASIIGTFRQDGHQYDGRQDAKLLRGALANLKEYKRALTVKAPQRHLSRWRIARRIRSLEAELAVRDSTAGHAGGQMLWALLTLRPRVLLSLVRQAVRRARSEDRP